MIHQQHILSFTKISVLRFVQQKPTQWDISAFPVIQLVKNVPMVVQQAAHNVHLEDFCIKINASLLVPEVTLEVKFIIK